MKKKFKNIKVNKLKLGIIFLVFSMCIGYAAIKTSLKFNGFASMSYLGDQNFRVYISRAFLNDEGKSNIISEDQKSFTFTYGDIKKSDADIKYTVKNTSTSYYADVEVSCNPRKIDGTTFVYDEEGENLISQKFRVGPGRSLTSNIKLFLPATTMTVETENVGLGEHIKSLSKGSDSSIDFNTSNGTGVYESTNTNSSKSVYYYRGYNAKNDVIFAGRCWKILRTTESGGVRLLYNGTPIGESCLDFSASLGIQSLDNVLEIDESNKFNNNAYAGYKYGLLNALGYNDAHRNTNDSVFKTKVDDWYEEYILNTNYAQYVWDDVYYNDRSILEDYTLVTSTDTFDGRGYGTFTTLYKSAGRASNIATSLAPTFKTPNNNDAFTVSNNTSGNSDLKYPVGFLTADELVYAGVGKVDGNANSWLQTYDRFILTMSPIGYYNGTMNYVALNGRKLGTYPSDIKTEKAYILPVITINPDLIVMKGDGASSSPFVLSSEDLYENSYTCSMNVNKIGFSEILESRNPLLDLEVGEEYCFGEECFYTISNDQNGTIKMISKYNLYVGNIYYENTHTAISTTDPLYGKQNSSALATPPPTYVQYPRVGTTAYSKNTTDNSYANSVVKPYVDSYGEYMKNLTGYNIEAALITKDELVNLGCVVNSLTDSNCNNPKFDWVTNTTYWTMTPANKTVYLVGSDGFFKAPTTTSNLTNDNLRGVRPVITIKVPTKNKDVIFVTGNGELVGDEICIGEECFYVLDYDGKNYTLFAKYNLYAGYEYSSGSQKTISTSDPAYGKQSSLALGDIGSPVYGTMKYTDTVAAVNYYTNYLNTTYGMTATGRLITPSELASLGCDANRYATDTSAYKNWGCEYPGYSKYSWVLNSTYWADSTSSTLYLVGGDGFYKPLDRTTSQESNSNSRGARPVIVVPASDIKSPDYVVPSAPYPTTWDDGGIFSDSYEKAYQKLKTLTNEEKVGQLLVASYSSQSDALNAVKNYKVGGVLFFESAFTGKTLAQVQNMTSELQSNASIPLMLPVDEEGGRVVRISPNKNLVADELKKYPDLFYTNSNSKNAWRLANDLYEASGNNFDLIIQEEQVRNNVLKNLGLNMNFAPVVDIATPPAYISDRSFGDNAELVAQYAETVINAGKNSGVSHSLKHFPGYGNNEDSHSGSVEDTETNLEDLKNIHLVPFVAGINSGAHSVMLTHNIVAALDKDNPSSLSKTVHNLLFDELGFTGLAITDDLSMKAIGDKYEKQYLKAFQAGNHILLTSSSYATARDEILTALNNGTITKDELNHRVFKILAWKYHMGLLS